MGEPPAHGPGPAGLLPVPRRAHGAVGRPGVDRLHRRHRHRRRARPQRPAPVALLGHRRRPGGHGLRGRRARHPDPSKVVQRGRLQPGRMFLVDTAQGRIVADDEIKSDLAAEHPYARVAGRRADPLRRPARPASPSPRSTRRWSPTSACSATPTEDLKILLGPDGPAPAPSRSARWAPTPRSPCCRSGPGCSTTTSSSCSPRSPTRRSTPSARSWSPRWPAPSARRATCSHPSRPAAARSSCPSPILTNEELAKLLYINEDGTQPGWRTFAVDGLFPAPVARPPARRCGAPSTTSAPQVERAPSPTGPRSSSSPTATARPELAPIPALLLVSAVHHHLIEEKTRTRVGLVVETGEAREVHHMALLLGYGAAAINPYLAFDTIDDLIGDGVLGGVTPRQAVQQLRQGVAARACSRSCRRWASRPWPPTPGPRSSRPSACPRDVVDALLHRHGQPHRRDRPRRDRRRGAGPPRHGLARPGRPSWPTATSTSAASTSGGARASTTSSTRRRSTSCSTPPAPALRRLQAVHPGRRRPGRPGWPRCGGCSASATRPRSGARPCPIDEVEPVSEIVQAVLHRGDVLRLDLGRGPRDPGHRHEPHRRPVQHRRGRRGRRPLHARPQRRPAAQRHQAGGVGPLRGDQRVPGQRRRPPDQDGPGGQAGRGRPAARATRCTRGSPRPGTPRPASG